MRVRHALPALALAAVALPLGAESLLPETLPPPAATPKPQEPATHPPAATPDPPGPVPPPAESQAADIPAASRPSRPSAPRQTLTPSGVRIVEIKPSTRNDAYIVIELWVAKGKWERDFQNVKKGEPIGKLHPPRMGVPEKDFRTPWRLADLRTVSQPYTETVTDYERDAQGNPVLNPKGQRIPKTVQVTKQRQAVRAALEHAWAKDKDGRPVAGTLEQYLPASLPEIPEDQRPPAPPPEEIP